MSMPAAPAPYPPPAPPPQKSGSSTCLIVGCIGCALLILLVLLGFGLMTYFWYRLAMDCTSEQPVELPVYELADGQFEELQDRWDTFIDNVESGQPARLELSDDDLNAWIAGQAEHDTDLGQYFGPGKVYFKVEDDQLSVDASVPLGELPLVAGRYFNGSITGNVDMEAGRFRVIVTSITVGDEVPDDPQVRQFAEQFLNQLLNDPNNRDLQGKIRQIDRIEIKDGKVILEKD
jgi:hypothetical protein